MNGYQPSGGYAPVPYGYGPGGYPAVTEKNPVSRKENESRRQTLFRQLSTMWRGKDDPRESRIEIIHVRSGSRVVEWVLGEKDTPAVTADRCMEECDGFLKGGIAQGAQAFSVLFDGTPLSLWVYGENFAPENDLQGAFIEQVLRHSEGKETRANEMLDTVLRNQTETIKWLTEGMKQRDQALTELSVREVERSKLYVDLMDRKHERDLEMKKLESAESRKERAADLFIDFASRISGVVSKNASDMIERKMSEPSAIDKVAAWLRDGPEKKVFEHLILTAIERAKKSAEEKAGEAGGAAASEASGAAAAGKDTATPQAEAGAAARGSEPAPEGNAAPVAARSPWEAQDGLSGGLFATSPGPESPTPEQ